MNEDNTADTARSATPAHIDTMRNRIAVQAALQAFVRALGLTRAAIQRYAELHIDADLPAEGRSNVERDASFLTIEGSFQALDTSASNFVERLRVASPSLPKEPLL